MAKDFEKLVRLTEKVIESEQYKNARSDELTDMLNQTTDGYWDWNIETDYEYMSPRFWEIMGYDYTTKKHHPSEWMKLLHPDDLETVKTNIENHFKTGGDSPYIQKVRFFKPDGSTIEILCKGKVIEWKEDGSPKRMVGTHTDLTPLSEES